jgi:predicted amidohydrolase
MPHYKESSGLCPTCQERRLVRRKSISGPVHAIHITLSFLTLGMWLIVYVINFAARQDTWRCAVCWPRCWAS